MDSPPHDKRDRIRRALDNLNVKRTDVQAPAGEKPRTGLISHFELRRFFAAPGSPRSDGPEPREDSGGAGPEAAAAVGAGGAGPEAAATAGAEGAGFEAEAAEVAEGAGFEAKAAEVAEGAGPEAGTPAGGEGSTARDRGPIPAARAMALRDAGTPKLAGTPRIEVVRVACVGDDPRLILVHEPDSPRAASFRILRHRVSAAARVVVVSSALPREGKSTCAVNLAIALAEHEPTLLLEANVDRPSIADMNGFTPPVCVTTGYTRVVEALWPNLHVLAVDPDRRTRGSRIDGELLRSALRDLQQAGYGRIVIDAPPIQGHVDVNLIQELADGVIITVIAGRSRGATIRGAIDQLTPEKLIGAVLLEG